MNKFVFILNPQARNGQSKKIWSKIENELMQKGISYELYRTTGPMDAAKIAQKVLQHEEFKGIIIAIGGDGTIHEVINGMGKTETPVTCLPGGSGCDFARGFHIPLKGKKSYQWVLNSQFDVEAIDLGSYRTTSSEGRFINNLGCGFDALVAKSANQSKIKKWMNLIGLGKLTYVYFLIKHLFTFKPTSATVSIDGEVQTFDNMWFITVSNHPFFGGGMKISPFSKPNDGIFELTVIHDISKWKLLFVFISVFWGGHLKLREVTSLQGKEVSIQTTHPQPIHADGESIGVGSISIQMDENALNIMKPLKGILDLKKATDIQSKRLFL